MGGLKISAFRENFRVLVQSCGGFFFYSMRPTDASATECWRRLQGAEPAVDVPPAERFVNRSEAGICLSVTPLKRWINNGSERKITIHLVVTWQVWASNSVLTRLIDCCSPGSHEGPLRAHFQGTFPRKHVARLLKS